MRADALVAGASLELSQGSAATVVVLDGRVLHVERDPALPGGVFVGPAAYAPDGVVAYALGMQSSARGSFFASLNSAAAGDALVIHVPPATSVAGCIHVIYLTSEDREQRHGATTPISFPRALVVVEEGAQCSLVEEAAAWPSPRVPRGRRASRESLPAASAGSGTAAGVPAAYSAVVDAVLEVVLDDHAVLEHAFVMAGGNGAPEQDHSCLLKATLVEQGLESEYRLTEVRACGLLTRHEVSIAQLGPATSTELSSFLLASGGALHDLQSSLVLDHPRGRARQLHKCIAADGTSRGVFDGRVRVNRAAQKTDASQLSRNLLLAPRAAVNVKPNLQIVADDVSCTHGATVSDLEDDQLFYLRSRGLSPDEARRLLVLSFGGEVVAGLGDQKLAERVTRAVRAVLRDS